MNPLTNVKNITKLNETELAKGFVDKKSWHDMYKESAWIFIGGLAYGLTEGDILAVFSQYGEIVNINLVRDKKTGKTKGFCFICYANQKSTILAVDNFNGIKLLGRTIRVDHVANYKPPKENENDDDLTKQLKSEGCAPRPIKLETSPVQSEKTSKKQKHKKEKKKHKKKKRKAEIEALSKKIKQEKKDPGYDKYENLHADQASSSQTRKRKISESESTDSERSLNDSTVNDSKKTNYAERDAVKLSKKSGRTEFNKYHNNGFKNRSQEKNRNDDDSESELSDNLVTKRKSKDDAKNKSKSHSASNKSQYSSSDDSPLKNTSLNSNRKKEVTHADYRSKLHSSVHSSKYEYTSETARKERKQKQYNSSSDDDSFTKTSSSHYSKYDSSYHKEKFAKNNKVEGGNSDSESKRSTKISHHRKRSYSRENDKYYSKSSKKDNDRHRREK